MFVDLLVSIIFTIIVLWLGIKIFKWEEITNLEWRCYQWMLRTFNICNHSSGYEYMLRAYWDTTKTVYSIRCNLCHDETWVIIEDKNNALLDRDIDFKWKEINEEHYKLIMENAWIISDEKYIQNVKKIQKNIVK